MEQRKDGLQISDSPAAKSDLNYQVLGPRIVAAIIDMVILGILFGVLVALFGESGSDGDSGFNFSLTGLAFLLDLVATFAYFFFFEGMTGATLGKRALGLTVVKADGSACDPAAAAIRTVLRLVDGLPIFYLFGFFIAALTPKNQRLGDLAAGTLVVSNASRKASPASEAANAPETADALRDLAKLHAEGVLTDDEYEDKRRRLVEKL